ATVQVSLAHAVALLYSISAWNPSQSTTTASALDAASHAWPGSNESVACGRFLPRRLPQIDTSSTSSVAAAHAPTTISAKERASTNTRSTTGSRGDETSLAATAATAPSALRLRRAS